LVAAGLTDAADDLFAAKFIQIVSGAAETVLGEVVFAEGSDMSGQLGGGEAVGRKRQGSHGLNDRVHSRFVEIDAADFGRACGNFKYFWVDLGLIEAVGD
jgi:hypothetical protein